MALNTYQITVTSNIPVEQVITVEAASETDAILLAFDTSLANPADWQPTRTLSEIEESHLEIGAIESDSDEDEDEDSLTADEFHAELKTQLGQA